MRRQLFRANTWAMIFISSAIACFAEIGTTPKRDASEYPVHIVTPQGSVGVEFMVRSFGRDTDRFITERYLTVEVAIYPANHKPILVSNTRFTLRVNGKKEVLFAAAPSMVAAAFKYSDWEMRPGLEAQAGPITMGRTQPSGRFPGDNRPAQGRYPAPEQAPDSPTEVKQIRVTPAVLADEVAIGEGETEVPVSGYIYFPYSGKIKSIRSVELIYNEGSKSVPIRLR